MKTFTLLFSMLFILYAFLLDTANAQLNTENLFKAPFISATNTQQSMLGIHRDAKSIMQNSEKDIVFIENLGQIRDSKGKKRPDVLFLTRSQGVNMYITSTGITYVFRKTEGDIKDRDNIKDAMPKSDGRQVKTSLYRLDMEFVGMNKNIKVKKELAVEQQFNYYTPEYTNGISPRAYKKITIENIYDGIDLVYYEKEGKMKYDFVVKAGADPNNIKMKYKGAGNVYIDKDGNLIVTTPMGEIREEKPHTYSRNTGTEIESRYKVRESVPSGKDNLVQFNIAEYNKSEDIIIDPYRIWATYYGGSSGEGGTSICTDNSGNLYVTGQTYNIPNNFPTQTLTGAYNQTTHGGGILDGFILKFNSSGERIWATYYGGTNYDVFGSICTDNSGALYVTGHTRGGTNFPTQTLTGAYNQTYGGGYDAFILKFNSSGARLWATYYGGSNGDYGFGICTDNSGNLYVTGGTESINFPTQTLSGAYNQTIYGSNTDAFILKFNSSGARLWATYYGGTNYDVGYEICTDNSGNLYVTGETNGINLPTQFLPGAYYQTYGGSDDAFILKFNSSGARLWATYYGGNVLDEGSSICTDNSGNLYVTGRTGGSNFPIQTFTNAYNQTYGGGGYDAFILKFNSSGARLWATYYGGNGWDWGVSSCTDNSDNLYVTGWTYSSDFPTQFLTGAYNQTTHGGGSHNAIILKFNSSGARIWATHYGGSASGGDNAICICTDNSSNLYVTGFANSSDFPTQTLSGAYNQTFGGSGDVYILKFRSTNLSVDAGSDTTIYYGYGDENAILSAIPDGGYGQYSYQWSNNTTTQTITVSPTTTTTYTVTVTDECNNTATDEVIVDVIDVRCGKKMNKVLVCHIPPGNLGNAHTICVSYNAVPAHLAHGDYLGNCGDQLVTLPTEYELQTNYPNPFNPTTRIDYSLPFDSKVSLQIFDVLGREVVTLVNDNQKAGYYTIDFNASNLASGIYYYRMIASDFIAIKKMVLLK